MLKKDFSKKHVYLTIVSVIALVSILVMFNGNEDNFAGEASRFRTVDSWDKLIALDSSVYIRGGTGDINGNGQVQTDDKNDYLIPYLEGDLLLSDEEFARADINGDGKVNWDDVGILSKIIGAGKDSPGYWQTRKHAIQSIDSEYGVLRGGTFFIKSSLSIGKKVGLANLDVEGSARVSDLKGEGNAYVCVDPMGVMFRSEDPCR